MDNACFVVATHDPQHILDGLNDVNGVFLLPRHLENYHSLVEPRKCIYDMLRGVHAISDPCLCHLSLAKVHLQTFL